MERTWSEEPFTHADLELAGIPLAELRRAQRCGAVRTIVRGVFVAAQVPDSIELRTRAVARVAKPHHVVTDRTAAWLHGVDVHMYAEHDAVPPIETCALRWHEPTSVAGVDGRTRDLRQSDVMTLHGLCVTTPMRTAMDLGCCLKRREAFAAMVMLARLHGFTAKDLERELGRYRRRRGVIQLRSLVGLVDPRMESQREAWVFLEIADAGLPLPEPQLWIEIDGVPTYRLDFAYKRARVVVEYDGEEAHAGQEAEDEDRRDWLRLEPRSVVIMDVERLGRRAR
jgi:hypothetical protein